MQILSRTNSFKGVYTALVTPFADDESIDWKAYEALIHAQLAARVHGVVPVGTTGETPNLSDEEKLELISRAVALCKDKALVIAGTGTNSTTDSMEFTIKACSLGIDAALVVTPYYNKPSQAGLIAHYQAIADVTSVPLILYNVPSRTGVSLSAASVGELAKHPNIGGIKEASGDLNLFFQMKDAVQKNRKTPFFFLSGDDTTFWPFLACGGDGTISVASNIVPNCMRMLFEDWNEGRVGQGLALFTRLHEFFESLFIESNPVPLKTLFAETKRMRADVREPLAPLLPENRAKLLAVWNSLLPHIQQDKPREDLHG